jgi:AcrR family transcriptional regulator
MSVHDITGRYDRTMGRWEPDSRGRLLEAAFSLFCEHGYDDTTVAEIAERAGLTERTFYRHFADKREVLFWGAPRLQERVVAAVAAAPAGSTTIDAVAAGLAAAADQLQAGRVFARQRQAIIVSSAELRERELIKLASLASAIAEALEARGVDGASATLSGEVAVAVFKIAFERWITPPCEAGLADLMTEALDGLKAVASGG